MRARGFVYGVIVVACLGASDLPARTRAVGFEERVQAQESIERFYYSHQIGTTRPFGEAVPRGLLEEKVRTYLRQTVALERYWNTPVDADSLHREMERMAAGSRMPDRLRQLFGVLNDDPILIQETLVRPALVDRLARNFFAFDSTIHAASRREAEEILEALRTGRLNPAADHPHRQVVLLAMGPSPEARGGTHSGDMARRLPFEERSVRFLDPAEYGRVRPSLPARVGKPGPVREERDAFEISVLLEDSGDRMKIARYRVPKRTWEEWWGTVRNSLDETSVETVAEPEGAIPLRGREPTPDFFSVPCLPDDTWNNGSLDEAPHSRTFHTAVWTGSVMVVWGGRINTFDTNFGGRYDPATDTWAPTSTTGAPAGRSDHTAVWTGSVMVVWGGTVNAVRTNTGGRYDPVVNAWLPTDPASAPEARFSHTAVWTGTEMIVWGGTTATLGAVNTGGRYDPVNDSWTATPTVGQMPRSQHTAVWTGTRMIVWGGLNSNTGSRLDPSTGIWTATSTTMGPVPQGRSNHTAVWTGTYMVIWGGQFISTYLKTGGRYNPGTDTWLSLNSMDAPPGRIDHTAVWTGTRMIVWGGYNGTTPYLNGGSRYDPGGDTWQDTTTTNSPPGRRDHTAVWTGTGTEGRMIVWGGTDGSFAQLGSGGRYNPDDDSWTPTSTAVPPIYRTEHTAVWTGSRMIVWGGIKDSIYQDSGGRYDPLLEAWTPTSLASVPAARRGHTAVWTGSEMLVWGGFNGAYVDSGGRYDPGTDSWRPISMPNAPSARSSHTAVWNGSQMIVWGGIAGMTVSGDGGRYDPVADIWTPTATSGAPAPRYQHTAVWTGSRMIVWGGSDPNVPLSSGALYDPGANAWATMTATNPPSPRNRHTAVWTGSLMVIWGGNDGSPLGNGSAYSPGSNSWSPLPDVGAPPPRYQHTAVWTGGVMIVWGGRNDSAGLDSGGRYNPTAGGWTATSQSSAPPARYSHTAVWMGGQMAVVGGLVIAGAGLEAGGGTYSLGNSTDDDGDGFSECQGDCNDGTTAVAPGQPEMCDGLDNDCSGLVDDGAPSPAGNPILATVRSAAGSLLSWLPVGGATAYDLVGGDLGTLRSSAGDFTAATQSCLANDLAATSLDVADGTPAVGSGRWYLGRVVGCGSHGTYDSPGATQVGARDAEVNAAAAACP